jgi:hypothetical protein
MRTLAKIRRPIAARAPDTAEQNRAQRKRAIERELRAAGCSRSHAKALASARLRSDD